MASQPLAFAELMVGGVLVTMGVTGSSIREVVTGKASTIKPLSAESSGSNFGSGTETGPTVPTGVGSVKAATPAAERFVKIAESQKGVQEGSAKQAEYASAAGITSAQAWCAAFADWALKRAGVQGPSSDPASVSSWENWSGAAHVAGGLASARVGDLIAFNGEHIGIYLGGGKMISGNWSNEVAIANVSEETEPITAVLRVKGLYAAVAKTLAGGAAHSLSLTGKAR